MKNAINIYGDKLITTTLGHGSDIAAQRIDDLDRTALIDIINDPRPQPNVIDFGCGFGWQGVRFSILGANSYLFDLLPESKQIKTARVSLNLSIQYVSGDIRQSIKSSSPKVIDFAFSQRFIHYLTNPEAVGLLSEINNKMQTGDKFYISASGIDSELGKGYVGKNSPLSKRFGRLEESIQVKHGILEPVCLYNKQDLQETMLDAGFSAVKLWQSDFGNIKGVFEKSN